MNKFNFELDKNNTKKILNNQNNIDRLFTESIIKTIVPKKINFLESNRDSKEINVEWDFNLLNEKLRKTIPDTLTNWYNETSSSGNTTENSKKSFSKYSFIPNYLHFPKTFDYSVKLNLYSKELGLTTIKSPMPIFISPYGCASTYGGKSDDMNNVIASNEVKVPFSIPALSKYPIEEFSKKLSKDIFHMYQLYMTADNDINISIIERAKENNCSVILLTIDAGASHGGYPMIKSGSDITFSESAFSNLINDRVFNIKCYQNIGYVATKDKKILNDVSKYLNVPLKNLLKKYNKTKSFGYARKIQLGGMDMQNASIDKNSPEYIWSIDNISKICHSSKSLSKFFKYNFTKGIPLVIKGILTKKNASEAIKCGADGIYVTIHGGRFVHDSIIPIDVLSDIRDHVKKINKNIGVWYDSGIRNGADILMAYSKGAEFVGIGRPVIFSNVLYGKDGVSATLKHLLFFLKQQAKLCGINNLNDYSILKNIVT
jgi:isopentenyl diphosphate isomerase/L-lactate dehydrogenase-like FMN-dependent dehydrogenase